MLKLVLGMIIILMSSNALAKEKRKENITSQIVTKNSANKLIRYFLNDDNYSLIERTEDEAIFCIKSGYKKPVTHISIWTVYIIGPMEKRYGTKAAYVKVKSDINCVDNTICFLDMILYDNNHTVVRPFDALHHDFPKSKTIVPDMLDAVLYDAFCTSTSADTSDDIWYDEVGGE